MVTVPSTFTPGVNIPFVPWIRHGIPESPGLPGVHPIFNIGGELAVSFRVSFRVPVASFCVLKVMYVAEKFDEIFLETKVGEVVFEVRKPL